MIKSLILPIVFFFVFSSGSLFVNSPAPNSSSVKPASSAPFKATPLIGGIVILTSLGIGYGASRIFRMRREYQEVLG